MNFLKLAYTIQNMHIKFYMQNDLILTFPRELFFLYFPNFYMYCEQLRCFTNSCTSCSNRKWYLLNRLQLRLKRKFSRNFREIFAQTKIFAKRIFSKIVPFSHDFRIFAKIEKCIFVSTLATMFWNYCKVCNWRLICVRIF
jgi:hypothetical protein